MFLENWKRLQMRLGYFWDLTGIEEEEVSSFACFSGSLLCFDATNRPFLNEMTTYVHCNISPSLARSHFGSSSSLTLWAKP